MDEFRSGAMRIVNIHEAKANLSQLLDAAAKGESFIIARSGKPLVKVVPVEEADLPRRFDLMSGQFDASEDFETVCRKEIAKLLDSEE
jgi:prevent-host-death family protein